MGTFASLPHVILASASPRRADLLTAAGVAFEVRAVEVDERPFDGETAADYVARVAADKARACPMAEDAVILAADTVVVVDGRILGKPADDADAARMLRLLSGRGHEVLTGVAVRRGAEVAVEVDSTAVTFAPLSDADIAWYVASGEPEGQGGRLRRPGAGVALRREGRRVVLERRRPSGRAGVPDARRRSSVGR